MFNNIYKNKIMSIREVEGGEFQLTYENGDTYLGEFDKLFKYANVKVHYQSMDFEYLVYFKRKRMDGEGILKRMVGSMKVNLLKMISFTERAHIPMEQNILVTSKMKKSMATESMFIKITDIMVIGNSI